MLKLTGVFLLIGGAVGFSYSLCNDRRAQLQLLKEIRYMYQLMQSEMQYTRVPLPQIFKNLSSTISAPLGNILWRIAEGMTLAQEQSFEEIWQKEMAAGLKNNTLTKEQKKALFRFPECVTLSDCDGQAKALQRQVDEFGRWILQLEEEEKSKNKVIMSLGLAVGIFLVILLL